MSKPSPHCVCQRGPRLLFLDKKKQKANIKAKEKKDFSLRSK